MVLIEKQKFALLGFVSACVNHGSLKEHALRSLSGDGIAVPCVTAVALSMLFVADIPGLWDQGDAIKQPC